MYSRTHDILRLKEELGHRFIQNTLRYTHVMHFKDDEFYVGAAKTTEEAIKLIESGFQYVCEFEGTRLFRKPK